MVQYPTISEYVNAIKNSADNFDKLVHLKPELDNQGDPARSSGGFAVVFKMRDEDTGQLYAIKCFTEEQENRAKAYEEITKELRKYKSPYLLDVEYLPKELFVDTAMSKETEFPVLKMNWVDGDTMEVYITKNHKDIDAIKKIYQKFCDLALWLRTKNIAHGDIKPDNIMIRSSDGQLVLVDYDGMYVPSLSGSKSPTIGTKGFSHPLRADKDFDANIDDFALASMSISLLAMSENADIYDEYGSKDRLLFSDEDYRDFSNSNIYKRLYSLGGVYPTLLNLFDQCLKSNSSSNKDIYDRIFDLQTKAPEIVCFEKKEGKDVYVDDEINLHWEVKNAIQVFLNGKDVSNKSFYKVKISDATSYELRVTNGLRETIEICNITPLPKPKISIKLSSSKLRKGKEKNVEIIWDIKNVSNASLCVGNEKEVISLNGKKSIEITSSTEIAIEVIGLDNTRKFNKRKNIYVFNESIVNFSADKRYSLPRVPVKLSWNVQYAKKIEIENFGEVDKVGEKIVEPSENTTYVLIVTDSFGVRRYNVNIEMLPLPTVKILKIPTPDLTTKSVFNIKMDRPTYVPSLPQIDVMGVKLNIPNIVGLESNGLKVELSEEMLNHISFRNDIKSLYHYIKEKIKNKINYE